MTVAEQGWVANDAIATTIDGQLLIVGLDQVVPADHPVRVKHPDFFRPAGSAPPERGPATVAADLIAAGRAAERPHTDAHVGRWDEAVVWKITRSVVVGVGSLNSTDTIAVEKGTLITSRLADELTQQGFEHLELVEQPKPKRRLGRKRGDTDAGSVITFRAHG